jgi:hypothetical protein
MIRTSRHFPALMIVLTALATCATAGAQQEQNRSQEGQGRRVRSMMMGGMTGVDPSLMILRSEKVQKELELMDDQKEKLKALGEQIREEFQKEYSGLRDLPQEERAVKMLELREKLKARTQEIRDKVEKEILLPHQVDRLKQLGLQARGPSALVDAKVLQELGVSDAQKERLTKLRERVEKERQTMFGGGREGFRNMSEEQRRARFTEMREKMDKLTKEVTTEAMSILTPQQKEKLEKMQGKKFDFDMPSRGARGDRSSANAEQKQDK